MRRLAGGMANDFNNILQVIAGNAESLLQSFDVATAAHAQAQSIVDAARRASVMTRQLQTIGQRHHAHPAALDISALVAEAVPELRRHLHPQVRIATHLTAKLPLTRADRAQMLEVLVNLAANANDGMSEGGSLKIVTDVMAVGPQMRRLRPWLRTGRFVRLEVADSGRGLQPECLAHVFEPFYASTSRCGSGLSLSAVYSVVKQSSGFIWVDSEPGQGTRVTILLPVANVASESEPVERERGRVLLVEDDEDVRELLDGVLMHHGYSVAAYASAEEALRHRAPFDLVLTDALLPGLSGSAMAREIRRRSPGVPILLMSGDPGHAVDIEELTPHLFLQKPFSSHVLVARVNELLSA